ncbi:MAG: hypothetical protein HDR92_03450 [Bacteroides sp.]|nr:hypothetical protein [Bacteroides sp.]
MKQLLYLVKHSGSITYRKVIYPLVSITILFSGFGCGNKNTTATTGNDSASDTAALTPTKVYLKSENTVKGHKEEPWITGNFTGSGIDTLFVVEEKNNEAGDYTEKIRFFAKSNNTDIPPIELTGYYGCAPQLVYEGDVDGDGKDEWGYLHTRMTSQWRKYDVFNYDNNRKEWRFLFEDTSTVDHNLLDTPEYVRSSGVDIVEKGPEKGLIKINYGTWHPNYEIRDTIVTPTYTPVPKDVK